MKNNCIVVSEQEEKINLKWLIRTLVHCLMGRYSDGVKVGLRKKGE